MVKDFKEGMMKTFEMTDIDLMNYFLNIERLSQIHYGAAKKILRYLQGTKVFGIWYKTMTNSRLIDYTNSNWTGSNRQHEEYVNSLGLRIFSWASKKQTTVS
ncbi:hypothetical protein CR513_22646, partial [Mucuna pruriens]